MQEAVKNVKTSALAVWSLILGVISLTCSGLFTGIPAVICGHMARSRIRRSGGALTGDGLAIGGLITGYLGSIVTGIAIMGLLAAIMIPAVSTARQKANQVRCVNNLKQIMTALYLYEDPTGKGQWPDDLSALAGSFQGNPAVFVCPATGHQAGNLDDVMAWTDYTYVRGLGPGSERDRIVLYCPPEHHHGRGTAVAFVDGHVEWVDANRLTGRLAATP